MSFADKLDAMPGNDLSPRQKLLEALAMYEDGVAMQRLVLQRQHPDASPERLEQMLQRWLAREAPDEAR